MKAVIYARCSTDEDRQDVDKQIKECQRYCQAYAWPCEVVQEYLSGFKDVKRPGFEAMLEDIRLKKYDVLIVYDLSRFSRQKAHITERWLNQIVYDYGCRFISLQTPPLDSQQEQLFFMLKGMFAYFSNLYSKELSDSIKAGIRNKKDKGLYAGGRPKITARINKYDVLKAYSLTGSYRKASALIWKEQQIRVSYASIQRIVKDNKVLVS